METPQTETVDSSPIPQTFEVPTDPAANLAWRTTGELPGAAASKTPKEASTPSKTASAARPSKDAAAETEPASATGPQQETTKQRPSAADRLDSLLADLKTAGLTPAELKTFRREAAAAAAPPAPSEPAKSEPTVKPQDLAAPVKPNQKDFVDQPWDVYQAALDKYFEDYAQHVATTAVAKDRQERAEAETRQQLVAKIADAKTRYGDEAEASINKASAAITATDSGVPPVIRAMLDGSPVLVDMMYVLGSKAEDLAEFIELAKTDPGAAIRKTVVIEQLVQQELAKGATAAATPPATGRDEDGKFVSTKPAKHKPAPPPEELNTRRSAPGDAKQAAMESGDFAAFKAIEDREDIAKRRGA